MSKLFVYGVNARCPKEVLEDEFSRCGEVADVYITGKGYAFVTMADEVGANNAIRDLNGVTVDGQEIKVDAARARENRSDRDGGFMGSYRGGSGGGYSNGGGRGGFGGRGMGGGRGFGGRGRGGGRGGGGGGRGCYNCHQDGHIARECPEGDRRQDS